ncbi:MAG: bifunctional serine/threonine-protein kinase/formylglycine-generating enzyme family protein [Planctomycetota bacterium]
MSEQVEIRRAVLKGLAQALPKVASEIKRMPDARVEAPVNTLLGRIARGEPGRTRTLLTLPPEEVTRAVAEAVGKLPEAERERISSGGVEEALAAIADSSRVRHTLLTHVASKLGEGGVLSPGDRVAARFEVEELVGIGGMGVVYRARDIAKGAAVALKLLRAELARDAACVRRFAASAELGKTLVHPGIVQVVEVGSHGDIPFLAMEWVEGPTLRSYLVERGKLSWEEAWPIAAGFLEALSFAHAKGVLHLDLKPENILLPSPEAPKLCDFDLARVLAKPGGLSLLPGAGTPDYMAPEQRWGGEVDRRADVYAVGVILYEMLAGRIPGRRSPTLHVGSKVAASISVLVESAIEEDPAKRPAHAGVLLSILTPAGKSRVPSTKRLDADFRPPKLPGLSSLGKNARGYHELQNEKDSSILVYVPPCEFMMGSNEGNSDGRPTHRVRLSGYFLGKHEVMNGQYRRFIQATGHHRPTCPEEGWGYDKYFDDSRFDRYPVVGVSWMGAVKYCEWAGLRLPTEAEWERAAGWDERAGRLCAYPWGDDAPNERRAVFGRKQGERRYTQPIDTTPEGASQVGCMDMAGNVWEWCLDWYDDAQYEKAQDGETDPKGADGGARKVVRGGSWHFATSWMRVTDRYSLDPVSPNHLVGFRVARGPA